MVHNDQFFEESINGNSADCGGAYGRSYLQDNWAQIAESTMPLKQARKSNLLGGDGSLLLQASIEHRSREISTKIMVVNAISMLVNLALAMIAFYFSFTNDSTSTIAFAADCVLDFISGAIVLWRYYGDDLNSVYMHAREQIACIYLGALFLLSAFGIIVKATSDMVSGSDIDIAVEETMGRGSHELFWLAIVATVACATLTAYKVALWKILRDNSILLDVINTFISTIFALSIVASQSLINVNPGFWYLDPVLSLVLSFFMILFGIKVICKNFDVLRPNSSSSGNLSSSFDNRQSSSGAFGMLHLTSGEGKQTYGTLGGENGRQTIMLPIIRENSHSGADTPTKNESQRASNLANLGFNSKEHPTTWQKSDYSSIVFA